MFAKLKKQSRTVLVYVFVFYFTTQICHSPDFFILYDLILMNFRFWHKADIDLDVTTSNVILAKWFSDI